ncbi:MAG: hypothetical protein HXY23_14580 [Parvularculaceae bacterium]|nr:hypothetical protein [Parvularculaceae bacterium]
MNGKTTSQTNQARAAVASPEVPWCTCPEDIGSMNQLCPACRREYAEWRAYSEALQLHSLGLSPW